MLYRASEFDMQFSVFCHNNLLSHINTLQIGHASLKTAEGLIASLTRETQKDDPFSRQMSQALLTQLIVTLVRGNMPDPKKLESREDCFLAFLKYLREHYSKNPSTSMN